MRPGRIPKRESVLMDTHESPLWRRRALDLEEAIRRSPGESRIGGDLHRSGRKLRPLRKGLASSGRTSIEFGRSRSIPLPRIRGMEEAPEACPSEGRGEGGLPPWCSPLRVTPVEAIVEPSVGQQPSPVRREEMTLHEPPFAFMPVLEEVELEEEIALVKAEAGRERVPQEVNTWNEPSH